MDEAPAKSHRSRQAGPKAVKKKKKSENGTNTGNQKAFTFRSAVRAARSTRRTLDKQTKKHHIPVVDRQPREPPPAVVMVAGPPRVGKSTLISSLVKNYTRQSVVDAKGPVTVVSGELVVMVTPAPYGVMVGKKQRLTLIECNNDLGCMMDLAKVADLV